MKQNNMDYMYYRSFELEGQLWQVMATDYGICRIIFPHESMGHWDSWCNKYKAELRPAADDSIVEQSNVIELLRSYFAGDTVTFEHVPLHLLGTPFQQSVWSQLQQVKYGELCTYGDLASSLGKPSATRAVSTAIGANPIPIILACHRIIGKDGRLTGFRGGLQMKQHLLEIEGITKVKEGGHERFQF